jgi:hypothetical protein
VAEALHKNDGGDFFIWGQSKWSMVQCSTSSPRLPSAAGGTPGSHQLLLDTRVQLSWLRRRSRRHTCRPNFRRAKAVAYHVSVDVLACEEAKQQQRRNLCNDNISASELEWLWGL